MADTISDDFAIANGIAAYQLAVATLRYLETMGVPPKDLLGIIETAVLGAETAAKQKAHPALPIAVELLQGGARQYRARPKSTH